MINEKTTIELLRHEFDENREIVGKASEDVQIIAKMQGIEADIYVAEDDGLIVHAMQNKDFDNHEMKKYMKLGESLYNISNREVKIYLLAPPYINNKVTTTLEHPFLTLKLAVIPYQQSYDTLRHIKNLVKNRTKLDSEDLFALSMIPIMGPKEDRRNLRIECLKLWKEINKKGLIK